MAILIHLRQLQLGTELRGRHRHIWFLLEKGNPVCVPFAFLHSANIQQTNFIQLPKLTKKKKAVYVITPPHSAQIQLIQKKSIQSFIWMGGFMNTFQHRMIHKYVWRREARPEQNSMIYYIEMDEKLRNNVLNAKVV